MYDCLVFVKWTVGEIHGQALLVLKGGEVLAGGHGRIGYDFNGFNCQN